MKISYINVVNQKNITAVKRKVICDLEKEILCFGEMRRKEKKS